MAKENLFIRVKSDTVTGEQSLQKALTLKPNDGWALKRRHQYWKKGV